MVKDYVSNLSNNSVLVHIGIVAIAVWVVQTFRQWLRLRHVPGPFLNSLTGLVMTYHCWKQDSVRYTASLNKRYGPLARGGPNLVIISDPETLRRLCTVKANYTKGLWFDFALWDLDRPSSFAMRDNESRKERKMKLLPAVSSVLG